MPIGFSPSKRWGRGSAASSPVGPPIAQFTLTSATTQTAPFSIGHAFKQGDVPSGSGVVVTGAQATIKNAWPDGSAKFAVISGLAPLVASTPLAVSVAAGTPAGGSALTTTDLKNTGVTAAIDCGSFGSVAWATTDWDSPFQTWISGPQMSSWVYRKPVGSDAHLVAWLEVRLWANGAVEVLPWVENGYLLVAGPTNKSATYTFTLGGTSRFSAAIDLPHHCRTALVDSTKLSHWLGTDPGVTPRHDAAYMQGTGLVPPYAAVTDSSAASVTGLPTAFTPLQQGSFPSVLGSVGGNNYVGLLPEWDAVYLTNGSAAAYSGSIRNAYSAGRYPFHYRDEATNRAPLLSDHPTLTIKEPEAGWETTPATSGTTPPSWSTDHQPCVGYLPYLMTGSFYHLETVQLAAASNALFTPYSTRESASGIYKSQYAGSVRLAAWMWRSVAQASAITPDADTAVKAGFLAQLVANTSYYYSRYVGQSSNPQGFIQAYTNYAGNLNGPAAAGATTTSIPVEPPSLGYYGAAGDGQYVGFSVTINGETRTCTAYDAATNTLTVGSAFSTAPTAGNSVVVSDGKFWDAPWQQDYVTAVWGWILDLGCGLTGTDATNMSALFAWKAQSIVGRLGAAGLGGFNYRDYAPYELPVSTSASPDWDTGAGPWFADFAAIHAALYAGTAPDNGQPAPYAISLPDQTDTDGDIRSASFGDPQGPSAEALPALAYAVKNSVSGASNAYQRLTTASNWAAWLATLAPNPSWAVFSAATSPLPAWRTGQAVNEWREITGTQIGELAATNEALTINGEHAVGGGTSYGNRVGAWCGLSIDTRSSTIWAAANGGHGDYFGNEVVKLDLLAATPAWAEALAGSSGNVITTQAQVDDATNPVYAHYTDGKPTSRHSYHGQIFMERHDRALTLGGSISPRGSFFENVESFNIVASDWDHYNPSAESPLYGYAVGSGNGGWTPASAWSVCKHPTTEVIYVCTQGNVRAFTPDTGPGGSWSVLSAATPWSPYGGNYAVTAVDTARNRLVWMLGSGGPGIEYSYCDLSTGVWVGSQSFPSSAGATAMLATTALSGDVTPGDRGPNPSSAGGVYVPELDAFLIRMGAGGDTVYKIDAATFGVSVLSTTGGSGVPDAAPFVDQQGIFSRWMWASSLGCMIYVPIGNQNVWALRIV